MPNEPTWDDTTEDVPKWEDTVEPAPPIIPRSGAQMESLEAREVGRSPEVQKGVEASIQEAPGILHAATAAQSAIINPLSLISEALTPQPVKDFMRTPIAPVEAVDVVRQAAQYPIPTLSNILFGTDFREQGALEKAGRFASEQIAGQTTPENLAIIAGTAGVGAAESILAKRAPSIAEILFGTREAAPLTTATESVVHPPPVPPELQPKQLMGSPEFTMVDEPKPEIAPARNIVETAKFQPTSPPGEEVPLASEAFPSISQSAEEARRAARTVQTGVQSETARIGGEPNATQEGIVPESGVIEHPQVKEGELPTETGGSNRPVESGEVPKEVAPSVPQPEQPYSAYPSLTSEDITKLDSMTPEQANNEAAGAMQKRDDLIKSGATQGSDEYQRANDYASAVLDKAVPQPEQPAVSTGKPPIQEPTGISTERLQNTYGKDAVLITKGRSPEAFQQIGQADKRDPYAVLSKSQQSGIAHPDDVPVLRVEHQRLLNAAREAYGTPDYSEKAQQAVDFANATKTVAHGPASDIMRSLQDVDRPRFDSPADFDNIVRERMNRESTSQEKETFQKVTDEVRNGDSEVKRIADDAQKRLSKYREKEIMTFDDAVDSVRKQIAALTKDCI